MARNPRVFLKEGDQLTLTVERLGEQRHTVVAEA
jgi:2-keto-4-pentenoate hydratase/2-oxohepta-3-ene-1,7-dioic acid hydratase in catechol pathway